MVHDVKTFDIKKLDDDLVSVSYTGSLVLMPLIDYNDLDRAKGRLDVATKAAKLANERANIMTERAKSADNRAKTAVKEAQEDFLSSHRGGYDKIGCGNRADAEIIACAVRGIPVKDILKRRFTYNREGHKKVYGRTKIFDALSVSKPDDITRINKLVLDFPEVFSDISPNDVFEWAYKKAHKKGGSSSERNSK